MIVASQAIKLEAKDEKSCSFYTIYYNSSIKAKQAGRAAVSDSFIDV
jgi:hypothetical protein